MSFKSFSTAQNAPAKAGTADKSKAAALPGKPAAQPAQKPVDAAAKPKT